MDGSFCSVLILQFEDQAPNPPWNILYSPTNKGHVAKLISRFYGMCLSLPSLLRLYSPIDGEGVCTNAYTKPPRPR